MLLLFTILVQSRDCAATLARLNPVPDDEGQQGCGDDTREDHERDQHVVVASLTLVDVVTGTTAQQKQLATAILYI